MDRLLALAGVLLLFLTALCAWPRHPGGEQLALASCGLALAFFSWQWIRLRLALLPALLLAPALPLAALIFTRHGHSAGVQALAAATLALGGRFFLLRAARDRKAHASSLAAALEKRLPAVCHVFVDLDIESQASLASLQVGHVVRVDPGETVPADGLVTVGSGFVDESLGLGQELPRLKAPGASVYAGTLNKNTTLLFRATAVGESTMLARFAAELRDSPTHFSIRRWQQVDLLLTVFGAAFFALSGLQQSFHVLLLSNSTAFVALAGAFASRLAERSACQGWAWGHHGLEHVARAGLLVSRAEGVFTAGRPRLAAVETVAGLTEDSVLRLLSPLARKLESPEAFAILAENRKRNIPLEQAEFFEHGPGGGSILVEGQAIRWLDLTTARAEHRVLGSLEPFVRSHCDGGESVLFLEQEGQLVAALAFDDSLLPEAPAAAGLLSRHGVPVLLVSPLSRSAAERQRSAFGIEHVHADAGEGETEALLEKLGRERMHPAWVQATGRFRPRAGAVLAEGLFAAGADLALLRTDLSSLALALVFARLAALRFRAWLACLAGAQTGLLLLSLSASPRLGAALGLGHGWPLHSLALAAASLLPGYCALLTVLPLPRSSACTAG